MVCQWQDRSTEAIFTGTHTTHHTRLDCIGSASFTASCHLNLEPQLAQALISFFCLLIFCGETVLVLPLASNDKSSLTPSGMGQETLLGTSTGSSLLLQLVYTGSWSAMALNCPEKHQSLLLCFEWCQKLTDCDPSSLSTEALLWVLFFPLPVYPSSDTWLFCINNLIAVFTGISLSKKNKHHTLEWCQTTITQILSQTHSILLNCSQH